MIEVENCLVVGRDYNVGVLLKRVCKKRDPVVPKHCSILRITEIYTWDHVTPLSQCNLTALWGEVVKYLHNPFPPCAGQVTRQPMTRHVITGSSQSPWKPTEPGLVYGHTP